VLFTDGAANIWNAANGHAAGARGPCDYAVKMAHRAAAAGYLVYTIAYGADENCTYEDSGSPWANKSAVSMLAAMASDPSYAYVAPRAADLDPIFQAIGMDLAGGSKLVK